GALAADEVAVAGAGAALARGHLVGVHRKAGRAARFAPFEPGIGEDLVQPLGLCLVLHQPRSGHDDGPPYALGLVPPAKDLGGGAQVLDPAVGAASDKDVLDRNV